MSGLRCIVGNKEVNAGLQDSGSILFIITVGVWGGTRENPIRGLQVVLRGVEGRSPFDNQHVSWLDKSLPTGTPIRVLVDFGTAKVTPAPRQRLMLPEEDEQSLRKAFYWVDRLFPKKFLSRYSLTEKMVEPIVLDKCSYCLAINKNEQHLATIGTSWNAMARIALTVSATSESVCVLDLIGYDGQDSFTWGSYPLLDGDRLGFGFVRNTVPDPIRKVSQDRQSVLGMIVLFVTFGLVRLFRVKNRKNK